MGRDWLNQELENWLTDLKGRAFVITGEPGIGKSSIAAWLSVVRRDQTIAIHFCTDSNTRTLNPFEFVASLVGQLCTQVSGFSEIAALRQPEVRRTCASDAFRELVVEPSRRVTPPARPLLAVVDSLDEAVAQEGETLLDVLVNQAENLPSWLRIVATSRPDERVLMKVGGWRKFELKADRGEHFRFGTIHSGPTGPVKPCQRILSKIGPIHF
jgi:AAA ATPase domain